jgi:putative toxin-antitoxin system antitoxin component (TIGR02293 family)
MGNANFNVLDWLEKPLKRSRVVTQGYVSDIGGTAMIFEDTGLHEASNVPNTTRQINKNSFLTDHEITIAPMLAPQAKVAEYFMNNQQKATLAKEGITKWSFENFKERAGLDYNQMALLLSAARNTLINKKGNEVFSLDISEKLIALAEVYTHGLSVFEDAEKLNRWLQTPNRALGGLVPFHLLDNQYGRNDVHTIIGRIEWGVYS